MSGTQHLLFDKILIPVSNIFLLRKNVYAMVNLKPIVEGHVLVCSRRVVPRLYDLSEVETLDFWVTVQEVAKTLEKIYQCECSIAVQDGPTAGQTVKHVHCHIIPKKDAIRHIDNEERAPRTDEDMIKEATKYRPYFEQLTL
ncbi:HIT-like domain [Pseudocohnilembus persalinus]|uniref:HIT-like domain n=1 Tax=Pseudocohnilembus persalinus TaxID=266149 RepID=A0A0V0QBM0_PSEPJ|nr:HIT-like domain [Pseudocohnilembus persalinus]|eukprot:KRW99635.1 HIT-like domain [Pseudocohnilembus persalinus]